MKIGILTDVLDEHSGARAAPMLARSLAFLLPSDAFVILATENRLSSKTILGFPTNLKIIVFNKSHLFSFDLLRKIKEEGVELISAHCSLPLLILAKFSGVKIVRTDYGSQFPLLNNAWGSWRPSPLIDIINYIGSVFVFLRDGLKFLVADRNIGISRDNCLKARKLYGQKIGFVYLGCDDFAALKTFPSPGDSRLRILSVSRFVPYKGFHVLVDVFQFLKENFPGIQLILVGGQTHSRYFSFLKEKIKDDPQIQIVFDPDDEKLGRLYRESQIYASATRWEGFGLPFLEASFFGLPTLGFDFFGSVREVIKDGETGFLARDFGDFEDKLGKLLANRDLRHKLGTAGQAFSRQFSWDKTAKEYRELFQSIIN